MESYEESSNNESSNNEAEDDYDDDENSTGLKSRLKERLNRKKNASNNDSSSSQIIESEVVEVKSELVSECSNCRKDYDEGSTFLFTDYISSSDSSENTTVEDALRTIYGLNLNISFNSEIEEPNGDRRVLWLCTPCYHSLSSLYALHSNFLSTSPTSFLHKQLKNDSISHSHHHLPLEVVMRDKEKVSGMSDKNVIFSMKEYREKIERSKVIGCRSKYERLPNLTKRSELILRSVNAKEAICKIGPKLPSAPSSGVKVIRVKRRPNRRSCVENSAAERKRKYEILNKMFPEERMQRTLREILERIRAQKLTN